MATTQDGYRQYDHNCWRRAGSNGASPGVRQPGNRCALCPARLESGPNQPTRPRLGRSASPKPANPTAGFLSGPRVLRSFPRNHHSKTRAGLEGVRILAGSGQRKRICWILFLGQTVSASLVPAQGFRSAEWNVLPEKNSGRFGTGAWTSWMARNAAPMSSESSQLFQEAYSESVWRQTTENFIRCLKTPSDRSGVQNLVIDNLRAAVSRADWSTLS